MVFETGQFDS